MEINLLSGAVACYVAPPVVLYVLPRAVDRVAKTAFAKDLFVKLRTKLNMERGEPFPISQETRKACKILANNSWLAVIIYQAIMRQPLLEISPTNIRAAVAAISLISVSLQVAHQEVKHFFQDYIC